MNLTGDPWIPVVLATGKGRLVSLSEAFRSGEEIIDLAVPPPQRIALTRLLVCIAHAALDGPEDEDGWKSCSGRIGVVALDYLDKRADSFELFGDHAFLQVPNLEDKPTQPLDKLDCTSAVNGTALFDHCSSPGGRLRPPEWSALMLLTFQCFSPSGLIGVTRWHGEWTSKDRAKKDQDGSDSAPVLEGSPLHVILRGRNLLCTIHLNLLTKALVGRLPNTSWGRPVWEEMPQGPDDPVVSQLARSYLGRLVPISRAIKLKESEALITLANGVTYSKVGECRDPSATVVMRRSGAMEAPAYLRIDPSKHPWRDLSSVLALDVSPANGGALVLWHLRSLHPSDTVDLWAGGLSTDPHPGKSAKFLDAAEWVFHLPADLLGSTNLRAYEKGVDFANRGSARLRAAVVAYLEDLAVTEFKRNAGGAYKRSDLRSREHRARVFRKASASYWHFLDANHGVLINAAGDPTGDLAKNWYGFVHVGMHQAYQRACARQSPRQLRAYAKGVRELWLNKAGDMDPGKVHEMPLKGGRHG